MMNKKGWLALLNDRKNREKRWLKKMREQHDVGIIPEMLDAIEEGLNFEYVFLRETLKMMTAELDWRNFVIDRKKELRRLSEQYKDFKDDEEVLRDAYFVGRQLFIESFLGVMI